MIEYIVLGIIQGIAEWLPISSEGMIVLVKSNFFGVQNLEDTIHLALFLHLGTFFAALVYLRKDIGHLAKAAFLTLKRQSFENTESVRILQFLLISFFISGMLGLLLVTLLFSFEDQIAATGKIITFGIGLLLLVTGYLQLSAKQGGSRKEKDISVSDSVILGIVQGFAALPGLSRSGLTLSSLLLRSFNEKSALKLSFLMSLPIVLVGNIVFNLSDFSFSLEAFAGLTVSFIIGLATIHGLMKVAQTINFGKFVIVFGVVTIIASLI